MADIYSMVQFTIELLYPLIRDEASLLFRVKSEVQSIVNELESFKALLMNAEERAEKNVSKKEWLKQVRNFAYDIEDVVDEYRHYQKANVFGKVFHVKNLHDIGTTIKNMQKEAIEIGRRKDSYHGDQHGQGQGQGQGHYHHQQSTTLSVSVTQESELVGHEDAKGKLKDMLGLQDIEGDSGLPTMIAVIGKQHLGKIAIVGSIYDDENIRNYFPVYAWVQVPRPYIHVDVLKAIIMQFYEAINEHNQLQNSLASNVHYRSTQETNIATLDQINSMDEASLQREIRKFLKEKRYMVVIDDVRDQDEDVKLAIYLKSVLATTNSKGSKIIMTTQYENVARNWVAGANSGIYTLTPLSQTKAWELFCKKAFHGHGGRCPPKLHDYAREILNRCNGEPYFISTMGCFMSMKADDLNEWKKVCNNPEYYLRQDLKGIYNDLIRSYHNLSHELKPCFLYFGLFPKDFEVSRMRLIRLWIAEGFISIGNEGPSNLTLEQVAQDYLDQLVSKSLVKVASKDDSGQVKTLQVVPRILHDVVFLKGKELGFVQALLSYIMDGNEVRPRRLSIHGHHRSGLSADISQNMVKITNIESKIRSLLVTDPRASYMPPSVFDKAFSSLKIQLLRVLDLCDAPVHVFPEEIKKILSLRYLSLRKTGVKKLESSVGHLQELQTMDLKRTPIRKLPSQLDKLHKLRHLLAYSYIFDHVAYSRHASYVIGVKIPKGSLEKLVELQKLAFIDVTEDSSLVEELKNLRQLRRLGIMGIKKEDAECLCAAIKCMTSLESLSVYSKTKSEVLNLEPLESKPPLMLKRLYLNAPLMPFPSWIFKLESLTKIRLRWSSLEIDPLEILESLPSLVEVQLLGAYSGKTLKIGNEGFKKLQILNLLCLPALESLFIVKGALPLLHLMSIGECLNLQVPLGIEYIPRLKTLNLFGMPWDFVGSLQPNGRHYLVVKHVPNVLVQRWIVQTQRWGTSYIE